LNTEYRVSSDINPNPGVVGSCGRDWGFSGDMSAYPRDREMSDEVILDLDVNEETSRTNRTLDQRFDALLEMR
jgi:hypothetical protein